MQMAFRSLALSAHARSVREIAADVLVVPTFSDDDLADVPGLDAASGGEVTRARERGELTGKPYETLAVALSGWKAPRALLVGVGARTDVTTEQLRRLATIGGLQARQRRLTRHHPAPLGNRRLARRRGPDVVGRRCPRQLRRRLLPDDRAAGELG
jgi:hypothetical protein